MDSEVGFQDGMQNAFVAMCKFGDNVETMTLENCQLFRPSFTNRGTGFTINNEREKDLIKSEVTSTNFFPNTITKPSFMKSGKSSDALKVVLENNAEEVEKYLETKIPRDEPTEISVALHNPNEPADMRSKYFNIPLGYSTKVYITPKAREIDQYGKLLTEAQRDCRLDEQV